MEKLYKTTGKSDLPTIWSSKAGDYCCFQYKQRAKTPLKCRKNSESPASCGRLGRSGKLKNLNTKYGQWSKT